MTADRDPDADEASPEVHVLRPRMRLSIGAAIVLSLVVLSVTVGIGLLREQGNTAEAIPVAREASMSPGPVTIYVHVLGEVTSPGLYRLDDGARVAEALAAAGGATETADLRSVNLARVVKDGEQIVVAALGTEPGAEGVQGGSRIGDGLVDLNFSDAAALESLPRIGPALAARIIEWREENGRFSSVDDLLAVPGIGEKLLAGIRDKVRV